MGSLIKATEHQQLGLALPDINKTKIEDYNLTEDVINMYLQNLKPNRIARECNKLLLAREDNNTYIEINAQNVIHYLRSKKTDLETKPQESNELKTQSFDVIDKISSMVNILEDEIDKLRNVDTSISHEKHDFFLRLMHEVKDFSQIVTTAQTALQPSVTIAMIKSNVDECCKAIHNHPNLDPSTKKTVIEIILNTMINENLLVKPTRKD